LPAFVTPVLLLVNASAADIAAGLAAVPGALLQFHGDESPADCQAGPARGRPYLRAARMTPELALLDFARAHAHAAGLVLDAHVEGYGGGGKAFDWSLVPRDLPCPVVLSGGLNPANVIDGITRLRPWAVDVSSGVELAKGLKDADLMHQFCAAVHEADARLADANG
jgi:phosphoribosylanthranilate isomerase